MSKALLDIINKKLQGLNESENVRLNIKAESEEDKEKIVAALKKEGCKCKEDDDGNIVVDVPADQKEKISETVAKACPDADCNEAEDEEDKVEEEDGEEDKVEEEDCEDDKKDEEEDDEKKDESEEDGGEEDKVDEAEDDEDVEVSEEDGEEDEKKNEAEDEEDKKAEEEGEEDKKDEEEDDEKKDEDCDGDGKCDEEEEDEIPEEDDEEVKNEVHEAIRKDIRNIAKTLKLDENALGQVETAFIAAVETRAKHFAHRLAEHEIRKDRRALKKDIRKMNENVNRYLTYVAKEWVKKNEVAIQDKLKVRLAENIINNIKNTLVENNITAPESNKIVEQYSKKIAKLEKELNEANKKVIEKSEALDMVQSAVIVDHVASAKDLTESQKSKLFKMVEDSMTFDYATRKEYKERVEMLAEMVINSDASPKTPKKTAKKLTEAEDDTRMGKYMQYLGQNRFE